MLMTVMIMLMTVVVVMMITFMIVMVCSIDLAVAFPSIIIRSRTRAAP